MPGSDDHKMTWTAADDFNLYQGSSFDFCLPIAPIFSEISTGISCTKKCPDLLHQDCLLMDTCQKILIPDCLLQDWLSLWTLDPSPYTLPAFWIHTQSKAYDLIPTLPCTKRAGGAFSAADESREFVSTLLLHFCRLLDSGTLWFGAEIPSSGVTGWIVNLRLIGSWALGTPPDCPSWTVDPRPVLDPGP